MNNMRQTATTAKYRPSLTAAQIDHILRLCKYAIDQNESMGIISVLAPFQAKIQNSGLVPAYAVQPAKKSVEESLGMTSPKLGSWQLGGLEYHSKEEYWEACYFLYVAAPEELTLSEIQAAREHMYVNDLMKVEEMIEFEACGK